MSSARDASDPAGARTTLDLAELVRLGAAWLPGGLLPAAAIARLSSVARHAPPAFAVGGFECRLAGDDARRVDFSACIRRADGAAATSAWLAGGGTARLPPPWRPVGGFLSQWMRPDCVLAREVVAAWLEFDLDPESAAAPEPFVIFTLVPPWRRDDGWTIATDAAVVNRGLRALGAGERDGGMLARADACIRALPPSGCVLHAALRPQPGGAVTRLILQLPWRAVPEYLRRIEAPVDTGALAGVLERLCAATLRNSVHVDVGRGIGPRIGIEFYHSPAPAGDPRWRRLFEELVDLGACTPAQRDRIWAWPTPAPSERGAPPIVGDLLVKVDYDAGAVRAKAYLPYYGASPATGR